MSAGRKQKRPWRKIETDTEVLIESRRGQEQFECKNCKRKVFIRPCKRHQWSDFCGKRCRRAYELAQMYESFAEDLVLMSKAGVPAITSLQLNKARSRIMRIVEHNLETADKVLRGNVSWTPTQARVFGQLMNKVIPDITASFIKKEVTTNSVRDMSIEDLEAIVRGHHIREALESVKDGDDASDERPALEHHAGGIWPAGERIEPVFDPAGASLEGSRGASREDHD